MNRSGFDLESSYLGIISNYILRTYARCQRKRAAKVLSCSNVYKQLQWPVWQGNPKCAIVTIISGR